MKTRTALVSTLVLAAALFAGSAHAGDMLMKNPTSDDLIKALDTSAQKPKMKFRAIRPTIGGKKAGPSAPATEAPRAKAKPSAQLAINFKFNSAELTDNARLVLDQLGAAMKSPQLVKDNFLVIGHTDSKGSDAYNQSLSEQRAASVKQYLVGKFTIDPARLGVMGKGENDPLNKSDSTADENRRVEIQNLSK